MSLRVTEGQARRLLAGRGVRSDLPPVPQGDASDPYRGMNGLERAFAVEVLEANGIEYRFNCVRLKLGEGAWYKPDFLTFGKEGVRVWETKGYRHPAGIVRLKVAASLYPMWPFYLVRQVDGAWDFEEVKR